MISVYKIFIGKPGRKRPFGRPRHRWEDDIKIGCREIVWDGMVCIGFMWLQERDWLW